MRKIKYLILNLNLNLNYLSLTLFLILILNTACHTPSVSQPLKHAEIARALQNGFHYQAIQTSDFQLTALSSQATQTAPSTQYLIIYLEGDGRSWINKSRLSRDPTPSYALGLRLAMRDPRAAHPNTTIAYLARPCQFTDTKPSPHTCAAKYWSSERFSQTVIDNLNQAIDQLIYDIKNKNNNNIKLELIGYSGGAGLAVLLAAHRNDVDMIRTVAGDLNHEAMSQYHGTTPLSPALNLNPIDYVGKLTKIRQIHYIGDQDKIVPKFIAQDFIKTYHVFSPPSEAKLIAVKATHQKGWEAQWAGLILEQSPLYRH